MTLKIAEFQDVKDVSLGSLLCYPQKLLPRIAMATLSSSLVLELVRKVPAYIRALSTSGLRMNLTYLKEKELAFQN
jgi:hypothetical protein